MKGIIFARVSSLGDRQNTERQIEDLTGYASRNNIEVVKVFSEKISGATKNTERKVLNECIEFAKANDIRLILCSEGSRVGRSTWEVLETIKRCIDLGIDIYLQKENEYKDIIKLLRKGYSVASTYAIAKEKGIKCSISTIKRVKKEFIS